MKPDASVALADVLARMAIKDAQRIFRERGECPTSAGLLEVLSRLLVSYPEYEALEDDVSVVFLLHDVGAQVKGPVSLDRYCFSPVTNMAESIQTRPVYSVAYEVVREQSHLGV